MSHANEKTSEGLKPSGQEPDAKAVWFQGDPQTLEIVVKMLCREFGLPAYEFKSLPQVIEHLKWALGGNGTPGRIIPQDSNGYLDSIGGVHIFEDAETQKRVQRAREQAEQELAERLEKQKKNGPTGAAPPVRNTHVFESFITTAISEADTDAPSAFDILKVCLSLAVFLMRKNKAYGDSALKPVRVLSTADPIEQIRVRMDDKISRLVRGQAAGEDALKDLVGYWVLLQVAEAQASVGAPPYVAPLV